MASYRILRNKTHLLVIAMVLFTSLGNILLSMGMSKIGQVSIASPGSLVNAFLHTVTSGTVWLGILCLLLYFVSYLLVLTWADYSYVMPASAVGYPLVTFLGYAILRERVSFAGWMGVVLICAGVMLVERTSVRTTEPK
ncbi:MAG: EamA family transporter [Acidobacteria bacterium]|nr:EamA family transporter [Acidobacteriota bacterium]MBI3483595.1 EamA family transporter [Acidobacteriota bacterium]